MPSQYDKFQESPRIIQFGEKFDLFGEQIAKGGWFSCSHQTTILIKLPQWIPSRVLRMTFPITVIKRPHTDASTDNYALNIFDQIFLLHETVIF